MKRAVKSVPIRFTHDEIKRILWDWAVPIGMKRMPLLSVETHSYILNGRHSLCQSVGDFAAMSVAKRSRISWRIKHFSKGSINKTPRELLQETLQKRTEEVASLPRWMQSAISTANIFRVPLSSENCD